MHHKHKGISGLTQTNYIIRAKYYRIYLLMGQS